MDIEIKDVIALDNNDQYVVVSKTNYEDNTYFYIVDINNNSEFKILKLNKENNKLAEFENKPLIQTLLPLFFEESSKAINIEELVNSIK